MRILYDMIDSIAKKFDKHAVVLGSNIPTFTSPQHAGERVSKTNDGSPRLQGEPKRKHLAILFLGEAS
jgi:hypothetical protein